MPTPHDLGSILLQLVALAFSFSVHEASHALVADRLGDPTARLQGRITLNPAVQLDVLGSIILPLLGAFLWGGMMGYAKPTPVTRENFRKPRFGGLMVALAGPISNGLLGLMLALVAVPVVHAIGQEHALSQLLLLAVYFNALLTIINFLPVPPLDGSTMIDSVVRGSAARAWALVRPYGILFLLAIFFIAPVATFLIGRPTKMLLRNYDAVNARVYGDAPKFAPGS